MDKLRGYVVGYENVRLDRKTACIRITLEFDGTPEEVAGLAEVARVAAVNRTRVCLGPDDEDAG